MTAAVVVSAHQMSANPADATPADVLTGAAELILRDGWCQFMARMPSGERCVGAALYDVTGDSEPYREARRWLSSTLHIAPGGVGGWNDEPGRTEGEVVVSLRTAAKSAAA